MRDFLVEQARRKGAIKRGGGRRRIDMERAEPAFETPGEDVLALNEALQELETMDPRMGRLVELRYFTPLSVKETAAALGVSVGTVERDWRWAKVWLANRLGHAPRRGAPG